MNDEGTPLCFIDCETDGVHPHRQPWEVAIIRREPDRGDAGVRFFIELDLETADPFGLRVGGFYQRHPVGRWLSHPVTDDEWPAWPLSAADPDTDPDGAYFAEVDAARWVARLTHGAHLVGAVPSFDAECLGRLLRSCRLIPAWHYHLIDVEALAAGWLSRHYPDQSAAEVLRLPWRSDDLSRACGVEPPGEADRHTAMADADWALRLFDAITGARDE